MYLMLNVTASYMLRCRMYRISKDVKTDPVKRWNLPDRVFFAAGACHILAYAFIDEHPAYKPFWIKPRFGYGGNHIVSVHDDRAFDYHGCSNWERLQRHHMRRAKKYWPNWDCDIIELPKDVLISEAQSRTYSGLWLREPTQFLHDALPRARQFLSLKIHSNMID